MRDSKRLKRIKKTTFQSVVISALIITFFVGLIINFYRMLYSETRETIIMSGQLKAEESAQKINRYLSTGIDMLKLACYTLDNMIRDGAEEKEFDTFLINQSTAIINITAGGSPGLYAQIGDHYLDGTDWVPDDDWISTERPWYTAARASIGRVAIVDPYIDAQTGTVMITLAKTLCDAKSVAALDFSLDYMQKMTEDLSDYEAGVTQIVLDRRYNVITHADKREVGKNYMSDTDSLGGAMVQALRSTDEDSFAFHYGEEDYIVYKTVVANDWLCLSLVNATDAFEGLSRILTYTLISVFSVVLIQIIVMSRLNKKNVLAQQLEEKTQRAIASSEAKSAFLSNMSHEIRTPINALLGMNEMILRESGEENVLEYAESVRTAGNTLLGLVNDILDFSKIEAGKMEILPVEYDLSSLVNDLVNMIRARAEEKGLEVKLDLDKDAPKYLIGDEVRIKQVITNILTNAVKYTEKGTVTFHMDHEKVPDDPNDVILHVSIRDTGIGIKKEDMEKLFSEFERIEEERNRTIEGTGLGMAITKQLLEMMGSSLHVESAYGEGSDFSFRLRQKVVRWEPLGDYEAAYHAAVSSHKIYKEKFTAPDAHVLVVDDTAMNLDVFKSLLKRTKVQIMTALSGEECLQLTRKHRYDLIFLDHMMPEKDGIQTYHEMREDAENLNAQVPTICLTANAISGAREKYLAEGFNDYLTKPIDADKLEEMLIRYLPQDKVVITKEKKGEETVQQQEDTVKEIPEFLYDASGIDPDAGVRNCGSAEDYMSVLAVFYSSIKAESEAIEKFYGEKDLHNYTIKVHALKSSARIVGALDLSEKAKRLEDAGNAEDTAYIDANTAPLLKEYRAFADTLAPVFERKDDLPDIPTDVLEDAYGGLSEFVLSKDYELARMVLDSVSEYSLPKEDADRFDRIRAALSDMNWDLIGEVIKEREN